jgi:hypothetical protein
METSGVRIHNIGDKLMRDALQGGIRRCSAPSARMKCLICTGMHLFHLATGRALRQDDEKAASLNGFRHDTVAASALRLSADGKWV